MPSVADSVFTGLSCDLVPKAPLFLVVLGTISPFYSTNQRLFYDIMIKKKMMQKIIWHHTSPFIQSDLKDV